LKHRRRDFVPRGGPRRERSIFGFRELRTQMRARSSPDSRVPWSPYKSLADINRSSPPAPRGPPIHTDVHCTARNGFSPCGRTMRERGARARILNSEDFGLGTAESIVRQRALRAAVLIDAIRCLVGAARMGERPARQPALRWILSRDAKAPFSFNNVCEVRPRPFALAVLAPGAGLRGGWRAADRPRWGASRGDVRVPGDPPSAA
jgi:hypothetical protein